MGSHDELMFITLALIRELQNVMQSCASNATVTFHSPSSKKKKKKGFKLIMSLRSKTKLCDLLFDISKTV